MIPALSSPYFPVGSSLQQGKYRLNQVIGHSRGIVTYQATHRDLACAVVVKTVGASSEVDWNWRAVAQRLLEQAPLIAQLQHPHLAHLNDVCVERSLPCLVFAFAEGMTAAQRVKHQPLPMPLALQYIQQVGGALAHCHDQGFIHGALSPEHIVIDPSQNWATLVGVGIDRPRPLKGGWPVGGGGSETQFQGTRSLAGAALDVYGLASLLYTLVTGQSPVALMRQVQWSQARTASALSEILERQTGLDPELIAALVAGLARRPDQRSGTVADWLALLPDANVNRNWQGTADGDSPLVATLPVKLEGQAPEVDPQSDAERSQLSHPHGSVTPFPNTYHRPRAARFPGRALVLSAVLAAAAGLGLGLLARIQLIQSWRGAEGPLNSTPEDLPLKQESFAPHRRPTTGSTRFSLPAEETPPPASTTWDEDLQQWAVPPSGLSSSELEDEWRGSDPLEADRALEDLEPSTRGDWPRSRYETAPDPWQEPSGEARTSDSRWDAWEPDAPRYREDGTSGWAEPY